MHSNLENDLLCEHPNTDSLATRPLESVGITDFTAEGIFSALKDTLEHNHLCI